METLLQDMRYGIRMLLKNPGHTLVVVLTLALGIGACTAIYSVVYGVLLRPLPYPKPDQVVQVWQVDASGHLSRFTDPNFEDVRDSNHSFRALAQYSGGITSVSGGSEPARAMFSVVSRDFFPIMGVGPMLGRTLVDQEMREGALPAIVSHAFWQRYLGGDPELSTKKLNLQNRVFDVVGVMPPGFRFPWATDIWVPRELYPRLPSRTAHNWHVIGRLKDDVTIEQARQELSAIARQLKRQHGEDTWMVDAAVVPLHEELVGRVRPALLLLLGAVMFLLLIAWANVINLLLAQATTRRKEFSVRMALGASRWRLARQLLTESLLLALLGGALGVLLADWCVTTLLMLEPGKLPRTEEIAIDAQVLLFALGISLFSATALGLACALRSNAQHLHESLKEGGHANSGERGERVRGILVASQVTLTLVLLVGAGLLGRSLLRLLDVDPGFRVENAMVMDLSYPSPSDDAARARVARLLAQVIERLRALPGVEQVGGVNAFPLGPGGGNGVFLIVQPHENINDFEDLGRLMRQPERIGYAEFRIASEGYFQAMGIPLLRGRMFGEHDGPDAPHVALISQSLAEKRWPNEDPIGKYIQFGNMDGDLRPFVIIGIVGDIRERGLDSRPRPTFYGYYKQRPASTYNFSIVMRGRAEPAAITSAARGIVHELSPEVPPRFRTLEEIISTSLADRRFNLVVLGAFGATALLLAVMGIYGVMSFSVAQRTREIGIRMALGAQPHDVLRLVVARGMMLALAGVGLGLAASLVLTRFLRGLLFGITPTDPMTLAGVSVLLTAVALLACYVPARRATKVDPMAALRHE